MVQNLCPSSVLFVVCSIRRFYFQKLNTFCLNCFPAASLKNVAKVKVTYNGFHAITDIWFTVLAAVFSATISEKPVC